MFERLKFARYAFRFERAYKSDRWDAVRQCFHDDATYLIEGSASKYDGETCGGDAIMELFKRMLDELDRKYDRREPHMDGFPRVRDGELVAKWRARYVLGANEAILHGTTRCRFDGGKIRKLSDTMDPEECKKWGALVGVAP
jgi:hypothetical protein